MTPLDGLLRDEQPLSVLPSPGNRRPRRRRRAKRSARANLIAAAEHACANGILLHEALDMHVHDVHADLAARVNNGGISVQIAFLVDQQGLGAAAGILAGLGVCVPGARDARAMRVRVLTQRQLRKSVKNGTQVSQWVHQRGRVYANLIGPDGAVRTVRVEPRP